MTGEHKATADQRRKALVTGVVLGTMALGVYLVLIFRVFTRG
jgi:hypothetical protein